MFTKQPLERDLGGLDSYLFRLMLHHVSATREFDNKGLEPYPVTFPSGFLRVFLFYRFSYMPIEEKDNFMYMTSQ